MPSTPTETPPATTDSMTCPQCKAPAGPEANFCEECGTPLKPVAAPATVSHLDDCEGCGAGAELIQEDGYCGRCGLQRRAPERDHLELDICPQLAGVSDRGIKHYRNEDYIAAAAADGVLIAVLCDGVSNSQNPDAASLAAAPVTRDSLLSSLAAPEKPSYEEAMKQAIFRAHTAVLETAGGKPGLKDPPGSTIVAATVLFANNTTEAVIGWLGDSRAYFIGADSEEQLSRDHSWLEEEVALGKMTYAEAARCKGAHAITRTLGGIPADEAKHFDEPSIVRRSLKGPGWLILCSDGLWNYAPDLKAFAALVRRSAITPSPLDLARELVSWAKKQGGKDNISVLAAAIPA